MIANTDLIKAKTKFTELIQTLSKKEWRRLGDFVNSPFHNKKEKQIQLYQLINKRFPLKKPLYKTDILPILYPNKTFKIDTPIANKEDIQLRKLLFGFSNLIEELLVLLEQEPNKLQANRLLVDALMSRKCYHLVDPILRKSQQLLENEPKETTKHFYQKYRIEEANLYMKVIQTNRSSEIPFKEVISCFTNYYLPNLLLYYNAAANVERILNVKNDYPLMDTFVSYLETNWKEHVPLVQAYYHIHKLIKQGPDRHEIYNSLEEIIEISIDRFDTTTTRQIFNFMVNFCTWQVKALDFSYLEKKQTIYERAIPLKIWNDGLYFSPHLFFNAIENASKIKRFEWANQTIEQLQQEVNPKYLPDIVLIAEAYVLFYQTNYNGARLKLLEFQGKEDFFYVLASKVLWIQIYYEDPYFGVEDYKHPLTNQLEALRSYLKRNMSMSDRVKESYANFMRFMTRLFRIRAGKAEGKDNTNLLIRLKQDILTCEKLNEISFLLDKTEELIAD